MNMNSDVVDSASGEIYVGKCDGCCCVIGNDETGYTGRKENDKALKI